MNALHINGNDLTLEAVREVAGMESRRAVLLAPDAREAVNLARAVVDEIVASNKLAYAITTGVGKLSDVRIAGDQIRELQVNLVRSHAVGVGEPLSVAETRAMMLLRANSLAKGHSGVRAIVIDTLCEMLNRGVTPFVPSQGSVGASGDLAPLAHLALALIGEGECFDEKGVRVPSAEALKRAQIKPLVLEAKETISLINGTQAMLAVGTLALLAAETLVDSADVLGGLCCDALKGTDAAFDERIHKARPHSGQMKTAANLRRMLEGSQIRESHRDCGRVQDAYSLRCIPQVHGAVRDTLAHCREVFETEANSAVDNPLVFITDAKNAEGDVISGGNFHGEPLAFALDFLAIALSALAGISERRIERLVNPALSEGLPPFLAAGRRTEFRLHDAAGHGGGTGQREQSAGASRVGRFDHDFRQQGRLRLHGDDGRDQTEAHCRQHAQRAGDRSDGRGAGSRLSGSAQDLEARAGGACRDPLGVSDDGERPRDVCRLRANCGADCKRKSGGGAAVGLSSTSEHMT